MIPRRVETTVLAALQRQAAVALIGPRQVGKTTLATRIAASKDALYLDLEDPTDREKLSNPILFLSHYEDKLVVLDEIHRIPELFQSLRVLIDRGRRSGKGKGRFLVLGSGAIDVLRQSGESLAGRIAYVDMGPFDALEVGATPADLKDLWIRGGYPDSYLAANDAESLAFRKDFIRTYLERDVPMFGPRVPAETLERLWRMLAHCQGTLLNASQLAASLSISVQTVTRYVDLLVDLLLVRRLQPIHGNLKKRLVKSPKVYIRDSGLLHALLGVADHNALHGHPTAGASWEGFVIENLLAAAPSDTIASFYRTARGAEIDLVLELPGGGVWAVEIKLSSAPKCEKGFHNGREDLQPSRSFLIYPGSDRYPLTREIEVIGLRELAEELARLK